MPQTSPMNWMMLSNIILFYIIMNSTIFSFFPMETNKISLNLKFFSKKWMW